MEQIETSPENAEPDSRICGLTGGIGSGKTSVAKIIEDAGFLVYYSDERARNLVNEVEALKPKIIELLGEGSFDNDGKYNRKFVSKIVFKNPEILEKLNAIIHPAVKADFENWLNSNINEQLLFKETALLFELDLDKNCKTNILVTAEDNTRIKRVMDRDGKTYREVLSIIEQQMPEKEKIRRADFVIYNNGSLEELKAEVKKVLSQIESI